ncbi:MAG: hypothetical protein HY204_07495 [Nitrospirae bacterium]|nr:hypothetical protein [Nitrospirota bacterium]
MKRLSRHCRMAMEVFVMAALLSGCGGGGSGGGSGNPLPFPATLSSIQQNIFTPRCASCHVLGGAGYVGTGPRGLDLSTQPLAYANLVNIDSVQNGCGPTSNQPCGVRVIPVDPNNSYLIRKLEGRDISSGTDQMPRSGCCLTQTEIDVVRQWILDGAPDN